ncbi:medium chain dehydrogenase/reductase family protein [Nocardia inohanensis]|uniref:medium chain dehydrogenase/reductase family protein n=1 Tax=Nocardia inohanensis TaxID=209246 RepID=UPI00082DD607|nr:medium chain dehydrogenase/reductase family protein [Nocardia inohanensis]
MSTTTEIVLPGLVEPHELRTTQRELPEPGTGQAIVRVEATGVSFAEQQMRRGKYYDQPAFPFVPGYDLVGTVESLGPGTDPALRGRRVAALTKTGGWATRVLLDAADLVPIPEGLDPAAAETFVVNGITAWQMLHRYAKVRAGQTILVHGANGGVGSTLVQLARLAGVQVIGTASARNAEAVAALGATPVDYRGDVTAQVRALAPNGVDAVFDHVGGPGIVDSFRLLAPGGTLIAYGSASTKNEAGNSRLPVLTLFARLTLWNALPNKRSAHFYNIWADRRRLAAFRTRLATDLTAVLDLAASGALHAQIAARFPLTAAGEALTLAESRTVTGKVVLVPQAD